MELPHFQNEINGDTFATIRHPFKCFRDPHYIVIKPHLKSWYFSFQINCFVEVNAGIEQLCLLSQLSDNKVTIFSGNTKINNQSNFDLH